jgi:hypothetical protein
MRDPVNRPLARPRRERGRRSRDPRLHQIAHQVVVQAGSGVLSEGVAPADDEDGHDEVAPPLGFACCGVPAERQLNRPEPSLGSSATRSTKSLKKVVMAPGRASIRLPFPASPGKPGASRHGRRAGHGVACGELATAFRDARRATRSALSLKRRPSRGGHGSEGGGGRGEVERGFHVRPHPSSKGRSLSLRHGRNVSTSRTRPFGRSATSAGSGARRPAR